MGWYLKRSRIRLHLHRRTAKTLLYRISTILLTQLFIFLVFREITINIGVGVTEVIRIIWYYSYDWLFDEKIWRK